MLNNKEPAQITISSNIITMVLVVLLVGAAFAIGVLWTKVQNTQTATTGTTQNAVNTQPTGGSAKKDPLALAKSIGLNEKDFESCYKNNETMEQVKEDEKTGQQSGVTGTPGNVLYNTQTKKATLIAGAAPFNTFKTVIDEMLSTGEAKDSAYGKAVASVTPYDPNKDFLRGDANAKIILIEYSDLECPFCIRFHPTAQQIVDEYKGQVAWIYRHFPLDQLHPNARSYAIAAECAGKLGGSDAFWSMIDGFMK